MKDPIIQEVRRIRKQIEEENHNDWQSLDRYFRTKQKERKIQPVAYKPKKLPDRGVA
jgi:hypothetical protein